MQGMEVCSNDHGHITKMAAILAKAQTYQNARMHR